MKHTESKELATSMMNNSNTSGYAIRYTAFLLTVVLFVCSCKDDDNPDPDCDTFSQENATCFCAGHPDDAACKDEEDEEEDDDLEPFIITQMNEDPAGLSPHPTNGTLWCSTFIIGTSLYVIDRESGSPQDVMIYDLDEDEGWQQAAGFPGTGYGLVGSANGKGYASSYASKKFWEYDPVNDKWNALEDLPFGPGNVHWVEYENKFYVPAWGGMYAFDPATNDWTNIYDEGLTGTFDGVFIIGSVIYWYSINGDDIYSFDLSDNSTESHPLPEGFNINTSFASPFTLGNHAYVIDRYDVWTFNSDTNTWSVEEDALSSRIYPLDVQVKGNTAYLVSSTGHLFKLSVK